MKLKITSTSLCLLLIAFNIQAQKNYTISPSNTLKVSTKANALTIFDIYQNNISDTTIILKWNKISIDVPSGWDYSLCDLGTCYAIIPDSSTMAQVVKGDRGFIGFNVNPFNYSGTLIAKFYVYEAGKFGLGDTCTFVISAGTSGISNTLSQSGINCYPNPASDNLNITLPDNTPAHFKIINIAGVIVNEQTIHTSQANIDISSFASGVYVIQVTQNSKLGFYKFIKS